MDMTTVRRGSARKRSRTQLAPAACPIAPSCALSVTVHCISMTMQAHLVGNAALLQAVLRQPRVGGPDGALDMI